MKCRESIVSIENLNWMLSENSQLSKKDEKTLQNLTLNLFYMWKSLNGDFRVN